MKFTLHEPIYRSHVVFCVGWSHRRWRKTVHRMRPCGTKPCSCVGPDIERPHKKDLVMMTAIIGGGSSTIVVWIPKWPGRRSGAVALLSHEMLHAALHTLRRVGFTLTEEGEEALTYLQQWLLQRALEKLK